MGTTLTGTTPQDTYDSLIKVTDNGPLSGTLKALSDGLGNDSALALSTGAASITGTLAVTGSSNIFTNSGGVPSTSILSSFVNEGAQLQVNVTSAATGSALVDLLARSGGTGNVSSADFSLSTRNAGTIGERLRITSAGNVGIGTSSPAAKLEVRATEGANFRVRDNGTDVLLLQNYNDTDGYEALQIAASNTRFLTGVSGGISASEIARFTTDGLTFNGDTAAANALDDYEEGTFTAYLIPPTSGTITLDPTYSTWSYTKVGRKVTINGVAVISAVSSPVGAYFTMTTLPFTIITANSGYGSGSATLSDQSASYAKSTVPVWHSVGNVALNFGMDASTLAAADEIYVTATYFV